MKTWREEQTQQCKRFTIVICLQNITDFVDIQVAAMDGWLLYECSFLPSFETHYFAWDENSELPEWINLENKAKTERVTILSTELAKYKEVAA